MAQYEIILRNGTAGSTQFSASTATGGGSHSSNAKEEQKTSGNLGKLISVASAWSFGKNVARAAISHQVNTVQLRTGSSALQSEYQFQYEIGSFVFDVMESAVVGALAGSAFGPIGGAVGGIAGSFSSIAMGLLGYQRQVSVLRMQSVIEDVGIQQSFIRAGTGGDRGRAGTI